MKNFYLDHVKSPFPVTLSEGVDIIGQDPPVLSGYAITGSPLTYRLSS